MKVNTDSSGFYNKKVLRARDTYFTSHTATDNTTALLVNYAVKHMKLVRG